MHWIGIVAMIITVLFFIRLGSMGYTDYLIHPNEPMWFQFIMICVYVGSVTISAIMLPYIMIVIFIINLLVFDYWGR